MRPVQKQVTYRVTKPCSSCGGSGREVCFRCSGTGMVYVPIYGCDQRCPNCGGSGAGSCYACHGTGRQESYETRWETEWVDDPKDTQSSSYASHTSTAFSSSSAHRSRRRSGGGIGRYVAAVIIGAALGSYIDQVWLGVLFAVVIAACTKKKKK